MSTTVAFLIYFMPSIVGFFRNRSNGMAIVLTNLFFGWTVIGWIIALIWAVSDDKRTIIIKRED